MIIFFFQSKLINDRTNLFKVWERHIEHRDIVFQFNRDDEFGRYDEHRTGIAIAVHGIFRDALEQRR